MKPSSFTQGLLNDITKSDVVEDATMVVDKLTKYTLVSYERAATSLGGHKTDSSEIVTLEANINMGMHNRFSDSGVIRKGADVIGNVKRALPFIIANVETVSGIIDKEWNNQVMAGGLTYKNANLLQFVSLATFVDKYARCFLNYYFVCESRSVNPQADGLAATTKMELQFLTSMASEFGNALSVLSVSAKKLITIIAVMPDITINYENAEAAEAVIGNDKVDGLQLGLIPNWLNPIYHVRMKIEDWQSRNYHEAKDDLLRLTLRAQHLKDLKAGKTDLNIEAQLKKVDERITDLQYEIAVAEGKVK